MFRTENDLWRVLLPIVEAAVQDFAGLKVKRAYQGSTQAEGKAPRLLLYRAGSRRVGAQGLRYCRTDEALREQSVWRKEDTFQAFALVDRTAKDAGYTALDVLETLAANLQGEEALALTADGQTGIHDKSS